MKSTVRDRLMTYLMVVEQLFGRRGSGGAAPARRRSGEGRGGVVVPVRRSRRGSSSCGGRRRREQLPRDGCLVVEHAAATTSVCERDGHGHRRHDTAAAKECSTVMVGGGVVLGAGEQAVAQAEPAAQLLAVAALWFWNQ
jgi:hypothetical protein